MTSIDSGAVLALDTASPQIALACGRFDATGRICSWIASGDCEAPRRANQQLVPKASELLESQGLAPSDVTCVVCGYGPGSFTGVRIGVATAKGIAVGLRVPLFGVSTIDAVAWGLWREGLRGRVCVAADAMRGEVYPVRFDFGEDGPVRLDPDTVSKPAPVAAVWASEALESQTPVLLAGDGLKKHRAAFEDAFEAAGASSLLLVVDEALWLPTGRGLIDAFNAALATGELGSGAPGDLLPVYTRLSDAEENERKRLGMKADQPTVSGVADDAAVGGYVLMPASVNDVPDIIALDEQLAAPLLGESAKREFEIEIPRCEGCMAAARDEASPETPLTKTALYDGLTRPDQSWWVAREHGVAVGFAGMRVASGEAHLLRVAVLDAHRRRGVAARLLRRVTHDALDLGATTATGLAPNDAVGVPELLSVLGFERESEESGKTRYRAPLPLIEYVHRDTGDADVASVAGMDLGAAMRAPEAARDVHRPLILAIESSCDETAAAIVDADEAMRADVIASQVDFHARFGGVVPEIASRKHTEAIVGVVDEALERAGANLGAGGPLQIADLDAIAVTTGPGLVGALVVGLAFAKGAAWAAGKPLIEVNHLEGHLYANRLIDSDVKPPFVALLVSGGNTMLVHARDWGSYEVMGSTLDDAVGEAFDKVAKALGLGYPGGPVISRLAKQGNPKAINFPRAMLHSHDFRFSLSGLKTAVVTYIHQENEAGRAINLPDLAASFQAAVVDVLVAKAKTAVELTGVEHFCVGGGVAANPELRHDVARAMKRLGVHVTLPPLSACTDNAAMIAAVALERYAHGKFAELDCDAKPNMNIEKPY